MYGVVSDVTGCGVTDSTQQLHHLLGWLDYCNYCLLSACVCVCSVQFSSVR